MCEKHQHHNTATPGADASTGEEATREPATNGCGGGHAATMPLAQDADDVVECPVMPGSMVVKAEAEAAGLYRDYEGNRYWFCCAACGPMWDASPDKYAA